MIQRTSVLSKVVCVFIFVLALASMGYAQNYVTLVSNDLSSNRYNGMPSDRLQVVLFYDGQRSANTTITITCLHPVLRVIEEITITDLPKFTSEITTKEYDMNGFYPYCIEIDGVVPDGSVDGVAVGFYWKNASGRYKIYRSNHEPSEEGITSSQFIGAWPYGGVSTSYLRARMPYVTDGNGQIQAAAAIMGAKVFPDGLYYTGYVF